MKKLFIIVFIATSLAACSTSKPKIDMTQNLDGHKNFSGAELIVADQEHWYRELRLDGWMSLGVTDQEISAVLDRINAGKTPRDQTNENTKGHWTYEFAKEAEKFNQQARSKSSQAASILFQKASTMWMIASYPNLHNPNELAALDNSVGAYIDMATLRGETVEKVQLPLTDKELSKPYITGLLHLPKGVSNAPVLLWTGGVDKVLTEHYSKVRRYVESGYAVITFDIPGGGLNTETLIEPGKEHSSHQAALDYVQSDARLRNNNVSALTSSGGGMSLIEFAIRNDDKLSAVVARCAVVDGILTKPFLFPKLPLMTAQSFGIRVGADINDLDSYGKYSIPLSLKTKGYFDGIPRMKTPLLAINTKDDMVASPEDMVKTAAISENGQVQFFGEEGHCPRGEAAEQAIFDFITSNSK